MTGTYIGIDLGGTKIEAAALDDHGRVLFRHRVPTPQGDYSATIGAIVSLVDRIEDELRSSAAVGIGTPGAISTSGVMKNSNSLCLIGKPLKTDLEQALNRPVRMANDANCFALSEAVDGAAKGASVVFGVILGTGVGGGVVMDGRVIAGKNGITGEWGHNPLPWPGSTEIVGPLCYCGKRGCIETFLSGPGMARNHRDTTGQDLSSVDIVSRSVKGDRLCELTLEIYIDRLARSLAHVINILDPDVVVLGGGMSNILPLYDGITSSWSRYVFSDRVDTLLRPALHGDSSGVRGAAWLWKK
jgi:fructokinase